MHCSLLSVATSTVVAFSGKGNEILVSAAGKSVELTLSGLDKL